MTNEDTNANAGEQGAQAAPAKTRSKKQATPKKGAPKGRKPAKGSKPKKEAKPKREPKAKKDSGPRSGSKGAKVLELIARTNGATMQELMKATEWQPHSIRGFLSTASKKHNLAIESSNNDKGVRVYRSK